jgi:hypothetical protein
MDSSLAQPKCGTRSRLVLEADRHGYPAWRWLARLLASAKPPRPLSGMAGAREALNREFDRMARVPSPAGVGSLAAVTAISRRDAWAVGGNAAGTLVEHHH